jgi:transposase-like protein
MGKKINLINENVIKLEETYGIHCVAINESIYDLILNLLKYKQKPVDVYYSDIQKTYDCYGFNPSIALQRISYSDIQNKVMDYKWLF